MVRIVFLDRDGVVNFERGDYTYLIEDFSFVEGIEKAIVTWKEKGYKLVFITNQGGIAKGRYGHEEVLVLHDHIKSKLRSQGVEIDGIYYCPHHQDYGKCYCRKPESLMIERALHHFNASAENCVIIGDSVRDIEAAAKCDVKGIKIEANHLPENIIEQVDEIVLHS